MHSKEKNRNILVLKILLVLFLGLTVRIFYLQVYDGRNLAKAASVQHLSSTYIENPRGNIIDRNDISFTNRSAKYLLVIKPLVMRDREDELRMICDGMELDFGKTRKEVEIKKEPVIFEIDETTKEYISGLGIQGISFINTLERYDHDSAAKHIIGYLNKIDRVGEAGIEKFYEGVLEVGKRSSVGVITDARHNILQGLGYRLFGSDADEKRLSVKLTLDYHIQKIVEDIMDNNKITGAVVVEDVCTGDIVAIASKPDFDQNGVEKFLNSRGDELFNRAVASYNAGSIFKIIDTAQIFETDNFLYNEKYFCEGVIKIGNKEFKCSSSERGGHGLLGLADAFALSCNSYFINAGIKMGYKNIIGMAKRFGFGSATGVSAQGINESAGNLPSTNTLITDGVTANIAIGQGDVMVTPLQVADMVATVANGGIKNRINIVDCIVDSNGNKVRNIRRNEGNRIISRDASDNIKYLMEEVTSRGTGTKANIEQSGGAAGKTGSAETGQYIDGKKVVHAWFAGYFPRQNPKYSIAVFVENGKAGGEIAAPVFAEIAGEIMSKGY